MPDFCAAYGCSNERTEKNKQQGITYHRFPSDKQRHQSWAIALRREGFEPKDRTILCSCHFRPQDFDMSGQTVLLRQGATPSIFKFPDHLSKQPSSSRLNRTSNKATEESPHPWSNTPVRGFVGPDLFHQSISDHQYALDPVKAKEKLAVNQENVEKLRRDLRNAKDRERRQKKTVSSLLEDLKRTRC
uniref:THAP-type domain-containing protein n=1 Tax=Dicentrarchus labrax TaxID=13489 RepID=A0A8P4G148_DICLA